MKQHGNIMQKNPGSSLLLMALVLAFVLQGCAEPVFKAGIDFERWRARLKEAALDVQEYHFAYLEGGRGKNNLSA